VCDDEETELRYLLTGAGFMGRNAAARLARRGDGGAGRLCRWIEAILLHFALHFAPSPA
jgi:hypothetical protein